MNEVLRGLSPPLEPPTTYRATKLDRVGDWLAAAGALVFGGYIAWAALTTTRTLGAEWFFVGVLSAIMLVFAAYRVLHSMTADRIVVTADGFVRLDVFGERKVAWRDVTGVTYTSTYGGNRTIILLRTPEGSGKVYLELGDLAPSGREFLRQLYHFAPAALDYEPPIVRFLRKLGVQPRTPKDQLERALKARLHSSQQPPPGERP